MITQPWLDALPIGDLVADTDVRLQQVNSWLAARLPDRGSLTGQLLAEAFLESVERGLLGAFELLRALAILLSQSVRTFDTVARYGGEEFVVILPESDALAAGATAERLRDLVDRLPWLPAPTSADSVTISLGVALAPRQGATPACLVQAADDALYAAKRAGKNRFVLSDGPALPAPRPAAATVD